MVLGPPPSSSSIASAPQTANAIAPARRFGLGGADLGMPLKTWRSASAVNEAASCAGAASGRLQICHGAPMTLGSYTTRDLSYAFIDGRLAQISFRLSIDGFDDVTGALRRHFGDPQRIVRDEVRVSDGLRLPHVLMVWRNGRSTITLSDPGSSGSALLVRLVVDQEAKPLAQLMASQASAS